MNVNSLRVESFVFSLVEVLFRDLGYIVGNSLKIVNIFVRF